MQIVLDLPVTLRTQISNAIATGSTARTAVRPTFMLNVLDDGSAGLMARAQLHFNPVRGKQEYIYQRAVDSAGLFANSAPPEAVPLDLCAGVSTPRQDATVPACAL